MKLKLRDGKLNAWPARGLLLLSSAQQVNIDDRLGVEPFPRHRADQDERGNNDTGGYERGAKPIIAPSFVEHDLE